MECLGAELDDAERHSSLFVGALEILFGYHLIALNDEHGMHIGDVAGTQTPLERIKSNAFRMVVKNTGEPHIRKNESRGK
jgi:hypothetical protein